MGDRREKFHEAMGWTLFRVRHQVAGKEVVEDELLRGATEHATAYPCEIQIDPGDLLDKVMSVFDSVESRLPPVEPARPKTHRFQGRGNVCRKCGKHEQHDVHELPPPPPTGGDEERYPRNKDDSGTRGNVELLAVGVDVAKDRDHFVVTVVCPCGSRASISSREMTAAELAFVTDWTVAHDGHTKGTGH